MPTAVTGPAHEYFATARRVVDGDTYDLAIDLGFECTLVTRVRLYGWNADEVVGANKAKGQAATAFVQQWMDSRKGVVLVRSYKSKQREKYGRWLVEVWSADGSGISLGQELGARGLAVPMVY